MFVRNLRVVDVAEGFGGGALAVTEGAIGVTAVAFDAT